MLLVFDIFFHVLHLGVIGFNMLGWIFRRTRRMHLIFVGLTLGSWLVLGIWYGLGYCFLTDWHWRILAARGRTQLPSSYTELAGEFILQRNLDSSVVAQWTLWPFVVVIVLSLMLSIRDRLRAKRPPASQV